MVKGFLPVFRDDLHKRGWSELDVIIITGDAYVDHPSFGASIIGKVLEARGFRVGIIAQPDWRSPDAFRGTAVVRSSIDFLQDCVPVSSFEEVQKDTGKFNEAFRITCGQQNPFTGKPLVQGHADRFVIHFPPPLPMTAEALDSIYELSYERAWHPIHAEQGGVPALETVRFSLVSNRGCCGECSFCSLSLHQGRIVQSRSRESLMREARLLSERDDFRGTITDIGGPIANLYAASCSRWQGKGACEKKSCLTPARCKNLKIDYKRNIELLRSISSLPGINHAFIGSGMRYDLLNDEGAAEYLEEISSRYISGQMKVAPEHMVDRVLELMNKPAAGEYEKFVRKMASLNRGREKKCYLANYFISAHPGATLADALRLAQYFIQRGMHPEQVQDFIPLPMTLSGCMYHTGMHPLTGEKVYVAKTFKERKMQRALIQYRNPGNKAFIEQALRELRAAPEVRKMFARAGSKPVRL